jgi:arylsulfatase A-like enzyme
MDIKFNHMKKSGLLFFITLSLLSSIYVSSCKEKQSEQPNILWITSEDNSKHYLKLFDEHGVETPNIDKLASQGLIYTHAFSNAAVCSAARSTLISGCYGPRLATHYHRNQQKVDMPDSVEMFPAYLRKAGYYTTNNSKEDYNIFKADNVWDESSKKASWKNRAEGQPFFHVFNIGVCHESSLHFSKEKMDTTKTTTDPATVFVQPNHPNTQLFKYTNAYYRDRIIAMDKRLGKVIEDLKDEGLFESTFIFYYGDHGGVLPGSKGYLYETGLHVPLVVHIPEKYKHLVDAKVGSKVEGFVSFVDFGPTVLSIAGVDIPQGMDGRPFLGKLVTIEEVNARDETYSYADRFDEKYDMVRALRKGKYKYIRNYQPFNYDGMMNQYRYRQLAYQEWFDLYENGKLNATQSFFFESRKPEMLFDVEADPYETNDLSSDEQYAETLKLVRDRLNVKETQLPDLSFYPEHFLINNAFDNPVQFGQTHKEDIQAYMDIADLALSEFSEVKEDIKVSLTSEDPWLRYWGIIVCSTFGEQAAEFVSMAKEMSKNDSEIINKVRAAEFLGLIKAVDPSEVMTNALYDSQDETEVLLILSSIVLMHDVHHNYAFRIDADKISESIRNANQVSRRLQYLEKR